MPARIEATLGDVLWEMAHRRREETESTVVVLEADSSGEAIEQLRSDLPEGHVILFIRQVDRSVPVPPLGA